MLLVVLLLLLVVLVVLVLLLLVVLVVVVLLLLVLLLLLLLVVVVLLSLLLPLLRLSLPCLLGAPAFGCCPSCAHPHVSFERKIVFRNTSSCFTCALFSSKRH